MRWINIFLTLIVATPVFAQDFYKQFSSQGYDYGNGIAETADNHFLVTGSSSSFADAPAQMFVMKLKSNGDKLWSRNFGADEADGGVRIRMTSDDGYYVGGYTQTTDGNSFDIAVWKFDNTDGLLWMKTYGTSAFDQLIDMLVTPSDELIILGETWDSVDGNADILVIKTDEDGSEIWRQQYGGRGVNKGTSIKPYGPNQYVMCGVWHDEVTGKDNGFTMKINSFIGLSSDFWMYNPAQSAKFNDIHVGTTLDYYVVGEYQTVDEVTGATWCKINGTTGAIINEDLNASNMRSKGVGVTARGNDFCVAGIHFGDYSHGLQDLDLYLAVDPFFWVSGLAGINHLSNQEFGQLISISNDEVLLVGTNDDWGLSGTTIFVLKKSATTGFFQPTNFGTWGPLVAVDKTLGIDGVSIYPNPMETTLNVKVPQGNYELSIVTIEGKILKEIQISGEQKIDGSFLPAGNYLIEIKDVETGRKSILKGVKL